MDQSLSLTLENVLKISPDEYMMFSEDNRVKSFQDWPFDNTAACNPKTVRFFSLNLSFFFLFFPQETTCTVEVNLNKK